MTVEIVEQLYYTWHRGNIEGTGGLGIFAHSARWPALTDDEVAELKRHMHLYGAHTPGPDLTVGDHSLARYRLGERYFLVRKTDAGADAVGRPGNFVAHALTGFAGPHTDYRRLFGLWNGPVPAFSIPADVTPTRSLPPVEMGPTVPAPPGPRPLADGLVRTCIAALLGWPRHRAPAVLFGPNTEAVGAAVWQVCSAFPPGYADDLTFSTHELDPLGSGVAIAGMVGKGAGFDALVDAAAAGAASLIDVARADVVVDLSTADDHAFARVLMGGHGAVGVAGGVGELATLVTRLQPWRMATADPRSLTGADVVRLLSSPAGPQWWAGSMPPPLRQDLVRAALRLDVEATAEGLVAVGILQPGPLGVHVGVREFLLQELARHDDAAAAARAGRTLQLKADEKAQLTLQSWLRVTRSAARSTDDPPAIALALLRSWRSLTAADAEDVLGDDEVGAAVTSSSEFRGDLARAVLGFVLATERIPMAGFLAAATERRPAELRDTLRIRLGEGAPPGVLADRLARGGAAGDVLRLVDALLVSRSRELAPLIAALLERFSGASAAMTELLDTRRSEVHEVFGLAPAVTRYVWPVAEVGRSSWLPRFGARRSAR